jgi:lipopolysaccharide/colanic/teichoic acid biosynthesis glycosyltransferase
MNFIQSIFKKNSPNNGNGQAEPCSGPCCNLCDATQFKELLALERKRAERSRRPFILMLLDISILSERLNGNSPLQAIVDRLAASTREVDARGWYEDEEIIGVIFTELGEMDVLEAKDKISERVYQGLREDLAPQHARHLRVSFHIFPEDFETPESRRSSDLRLYPDLLRDHASKRVSLSLKRLLDITGSLLGLIILAPLLITLSIWIKLTSKGPVYFRQERVGRFGRPFVLLKFRSMFINNDPTIHKEYVKQLICSVENEQDCNGVYKIQNDPRVTPVGRFIRKTSLDELPQLINVLKGEMSLVGPRPPIPYELEFYNVWHRRRILEMKPGITGLWQVRGRSTTTFDEMVRIDIRYSKQWSLWLDLSLLLQTPWAVLKGKGAY